MTIFHRVPKMILDKRAQAVLKITLAQTDVLPRATLLKSLRMLREVRGEGAMSYIFMRVIVKLVP